MTRDYAVLSVVILLGCSNSTGVSGDAATDVATDVPTDAATDAADVAPDVATDVARIDAGPVACGETTCTATQFCVSSGGGAGIFTSCQDIPAACNGALSCACLSALCPIDAHHSCAVSERSASCNCLDCP